MSIVPPRRVTRPSPVAARGWALKFLEVNGIDDRVFEEMSYEDLVELMLDAYRGAFLDGVHAQEDLDPLRLRRI